MKNLTVELKKCKRTGILVVLPLVGLLGALYAFINFIVRKEVLLSLPLPHMDVLLTQLYGMIMVLNMFGIIVATTLTYNMEFQGNAIKKMYMLICFACFLYRLAKWSIVYYWKCLFTQRNF